MKTVQLYSGGLDSVCIHHILQPDITLFVHLGTPVCDQEMDRIMDQDIATTCVNLEGLSHYELGNKILPGRNCYFVLMAANYGERIVLGSTLGDTTKDKDTTWAFLMSAMLRRMMEPGKMPKGIEDPEKYEVTVPFRHLTKAGIVKAYLLAGGDPIRATHSYSCYSGQEKECGVCRACVRKYVALAHNGLDCWNYFAKDPREHLQAALDYATQKGRHHREIQDIAEVIEKV